MPPREATHSFPDHFLTVDYEHTAGVTVVAPTLTGGGGGLGGGHGAALTDENTNGDAVDGGVNMNGDGTNNGGLATADSDDFSGVAAQMIQQVMNAQQNGNTPNGNTPHHQHQHHQHQHHVNTHENDPLSMGSVTTTETVPAVIVPNVAIDHHAMWDHYNNNRNNNSHNSHNSHNSNPTTHHNHPNAIIIQHHNGVTTATSTASPTATDNNNNNHNNDGGNNQHSPSSISQSNGMSSFGGYLHSVPPHHLNLAHGVAVASSGSGSGPGAGSGSEAEAAQYAFMMQNQHRQDQVLMHNQHANLHPNLHPNVTQHQHNHPPSSLHHRHTDPFSGAVSPISEAGDRIAMAQQQLQQQQQQQQLTRRHSTRRTTNTSTSVPRASSFGGFPSHGPSPSPSSSATAAAASMVTPPVSRSNSVASSITASVTGYHRSVSNNSIGATGYYHPHQQHHQHQQHYQHPQEHPQEQEQPAPSSPQPLDSSHATTAASVSPSGFHSIGNLSPILAGASSVGSNSPYSPYALAQAGSVLDQTSFPEEEDEDEEEEEEGEELGHGYYGEDDYSQDKYSPISKLDLVGKLGKGNAEDEEEEEEDNEEDYQDGNTSKAVKDLNDTFATMDTTTDNESGYTTTNNHVMGIASHVIHEESPLLSGLPSTPTYASGSTTVGSSSGLRPRPVPFPHTTASASSLVDDMSQDGSHASSVTSATSMFQGGGRGTSRRLVRNEAFELSPGSSTPSGIVSTGSATNNNFPLRRYRHQSSNMSDISIASNDTSLTFGPDTTISDLTYYAEQGCIVDLLAALSNPHLKTLGTRMLADYAKMSHRRVAVASNTRILEFVQSTALEIGIHNGHYSAAPEHVQKYTSQSWLGREYAVETVRSLTAAEENDRYLMNAPGLLQMLALVARGGPFVRKIPATHGDLDRIVVAVPPPAFEEGGTLSRMMENKDSHRPGVASDKARLHACIAIMNLSCGKSNKVEITNVPDILESMRDVMLGRHFSSSPKNSSSSASLPGTIADEARLKATTCIKNLSNADANDAALLGTPGLVETLGFVAEATCHPELGATTCTTHACLALMNLSISKANKNRVFRAPGVMDALMAVITRTAPKDLHAEPNTKNPSFEARVKACSALSNLAIGYDNKIPMFNYPGFVESILTVIRTDRAEARTKACSILWSFAAEMKNQVPVVQRGDILPALVAVAKEDTTTEARFKCVAALTLLAESPENAVPLLHAGSLEPLMNVLHEAGPDPTQWKGQTASWCVGFLMNMAQCDEVVPALLAEGIVDLLAPLIALDHYQSLKAAMAVTFVCRYDTGDRTYNLLRQTENVIPKITSLLHNTLSGRGGSGYKYGVFTLRSSVGCISSLASGPDFMKERIATGPVFESLLRVVADFCVDGGTLGAIVGGGRDDTRSATLAVRALSLLTGHLIPEPGCAAMPFGPVMDEQLVTALRSFELSTHPEIDNETCEMAHFARIRIEGGKNVKGALKDSVASDDSIENDLIEDVGGVGLSFASKCCGMYLHALPETSSGDYTGPIPVATLPALTQAAQDEDAMDITDAGSASSGSNDSSAVRTFLLTDSKTGRRFAVPCDPSGGRAFNDNRVWCFRRGRWCKEGEEPDSNFLWSEELQAAYTAALNDQGSVSPSSSKS